MHAFFFHARNLTGSYVIIPANKTVEYLPPTVMRQAALLALHYSKARRSREGDVYWTRKHWVRKPKGTPDGFVILNRAQSLFLKYEQKDVDDLLGSSRGLDE